MFLQKSSAREKKVSTETSRERTHAAGAAQNGATEREIRLNSAFSCSNFHIWAQQVSSGPPSGSKSIHFYLFGALRTCVRWRAPHWQYYRVKRIKMDCFFPILESELSSYPVRYLCFHWSEPDLKLQACLFDAGDFNLCCSLQSPFKSHPCSFGFSMPNATPFPRRARLTFLLQ